MQHNYGYDINRIISKANEQDMHMIEGYALQLDDLLSSLTEPNDVVEKLLDSTIEFLYGLVD